MANSKSTGSDPFAAALRLLTRRDRSEAELRAKLAQFGFTVSAIDEAIVRCRGCGYLDEARYARERARALLRSGRGVGRKLQLDLQHRGVDQQIAADAIAAAEQEIPRDQLLKEQVERRFPGFDYASASEKERRRVVGYFQRRGFPLGEIFATLKQEPS